MYQKRGFTLIELLVVVLIIGILSSVALPQYTKAVAKSRLMNYFQAAQGIRRAQEVYYLANNEYTPQLDDLDYDYSHICPGITLGDNGVFQCPFAYFDNIAGRLLDSDTHCVQIKFYSLGYVHGAEGQTMDLLLKVWFEHSSHPNEITCEGYTALGRSLCAGMNF